MLRRARSGDDSAREAIARRYSSLLRRWAHGLLPTYARDLAETDDLVQETLVKALQKIDTFVPRREGAFLAYLTTTLRNQIRNEIRRTKRRNMVPEIADELPQRGPSPLDRVVTAEAMARYESALQKLSERSREAVILFLEFGFSYPEIAAAIESTENAARMRVVRALVRLAQDMSEPQTGAG